MGTVSLIVMEQGSEWPGRVGDSENVVAVGHDGKGALQRTRWSVDSLRRHGHQVRVAVLACNEATDASSVACRAELAHELLAAVAAGGFGRLVLTATDHASMKLRGELLSLAGTLSDRLRGTSATISVKFGAPDERRDAAQRSVRKCSGEPAGFRPHALEVRQ
jgi:hypothetical protein